MVNNGLWLIPTLNRPEKLAQFIESFMACECSTPGILIIDSQDPSIDKYFDLKLPKDWSIVLTTERSMGDKIRETWNFYKNVDWVGIKNDDHRVATHLADKKLVSQLNGKNFISCNDGWVAHDPNSLPAGATIWSGDLIRAVGFIFPPKLQHTFIDNVWQQLGLATGCWIKDLSVTVEHRHVDKGVAEPDETHKRMQSFFHTDGPIYTDWLRNDFPRAVSAIKRLQDA